MRISPKNRPTPGRILMGSCTADRHLVFPAEMRIQLRADVLHLTPSVRRGATHAYLLTTTGLEQVLANGERPVFPPSYTPALMDRMMIVLAFTSGDIISRPGAHNKLRLPRRNFDWKPGPMWFLLLKDYAVISDDQNVFAAYFAQTSSRSVPFAL